MVFPDMFTTRFQRCNIIINCLRRPNLWNIDLKAMGIVEFKLMVVNLCHTLKFVLVHAAITIGLAGNMIFDVFLILMILCKLVYKGLISPVCT